MRPKIFLSVVVLSGPLPIGAQIVLTGTSYLQDFANLSTGLPTGWSVRKDASATSLGSAQEFTPAAVSWTDTIGAFKNLASATGMTGGESTVAQGISVDRALGIRQGGTFGGDPGAAFAININTTGLTLISLSIDIMMLSVQARSTDWTIDYGLGMSPASFAPLGTYPDPGIFGTVTFAAGGASLGNMDNQSDVWIRIVALEATSGSGSRDTMAIDNVHLVYSPVPEIATCGLLTGLAAFAWMAVHRGRRPRRICSQ